MKSGLIREVAFGGSGLIKGGGLYSPVVHRHINEFDMHYMQCI